MRNREQGPQRLGEYDAVSAGPRSLRSMLSGIPRTRDIFGSNACLLRHHQMTCSFAPSHWMLRPSLSESMPSRATFVE